MVYCGSTEIVFGLNNGIYFLPKCIQTADRWEEQDPFTIPLPTSRGGRFKVPIRRWSSHPRSGSIARVHPPIMNRPEGARRPHAGTCWMDTGSFDDQLIFDGWRLAANMTT
jgi:hypothetical protein